MAEMMAASTAIPSAPPTWRTVKVMPSPAANFSSGMAAAAIPRAVHELYRFEAVVLLLAAPLCLTLKPARLTEPVAVA
ncbi:hypothetical protein [Nocardia sp. IFM 10818]